MSEGDRLCNKTIENESHDKSNEEMLHGYHLERSGIDHVVKVPTAMDRVCHEFTRISVGRGFDFKKGSRSPLARILPQKVQGIPSVTQEDDAPPGLMPPSKLTQISPEHLSVQVSPQKVLATVKVSNVGGTLHDVTPCSIETPKAVNRDQFSEDTLASQNIVYERVPRKKNFPSTEELFNINGSEFLNIHENENDMVVLNDCTEPKNSVLNRSMATYGFTLPSDFFKGSLLVNIPPFEESEGKKTLVEPECNCSLATKSVNENFRSSVNQQSVLDPTGVCSIQSNVSCVPKAASTSQDDCCDSDERSNKPLPSSGAIPKDWSVIRALKKGYKSSKTTEESL